VALVSLLLQTIGLTFFLISQALFCFRARKEYGSLKKAFLSLAFARVAMKEEEFKKISEIELREALKSFPLAEV